MKTRILQLLTAGLILFFLPYVSTFGQNLLESRHNSPQTYIYQLEEAQARKIYKKDIWVVDSSFFHSLVDSVHTDSLHLLDLKPGHYLKTYSEENKQKFELASIQAFDVKVLNNTSDLLIQVFDLSGNLISDAVLTLKGRKLSFDEQTQTYLKRKTNAKGLLKISHQGISSFYYLDRKFKNSRLKRFSRKLAYGTPLKYAWIPIRYVAKLPIDGTRSIIRRHPQGVIYWTTQFFRNSFQRVACKFDDYYCEEVADRFRDKHTGYLVFNQPKYRPGDTVKFKAFILNKRKKPIRKELEVILTANRKNIPLAKISPYAPGGYHYSFVLKDTFDLRLDSRYRIRLKAKDHHLYAEERFLYEDYELGKTKLSVRTEGKKQYRGKEFVVSIKGTDENELNILDGRIEMLLLPNRVSQFLDSSVFIPDTLLFLREKLASQGETRISIPDTIFPKVNMTYQLLVSLLNSDNERIGESKMLTFYHKERKADFSLLNDSLQVTVLENGKQSPAQGKILGKDSFGNKRMLYEGKLPAILATNSFYTAYTLIADTLNATFSVSKEADLLDCYARRSKDSLFIQINNPRKLLFSYHIYAKNQEVSRGYADSLSYQEKARAGLMYYISIQYIWGGKIQEKNIRIPYEAKKLNIQIKQPRLIVPGQTVPIEVEVLDAEGYPVEGVDLTAYGLSKKFKYSAPQLPNLAKGHKPKDQINQFYFKRINHSEGKLPLNYEDWKELAKLDTIPYYSFLYPGDSVYRYEYETENKETQFAPFVISEGALQNIHVIYVDDKPVYFSWSTNEPAYSFPIYSGYHQVKLRTSTQEIILDSLYIQEGVKLILSVDAKKFQPHVRKSQRENFLSKSEQIRLYPYIFPYRNTFKEKPAFLVDGRNIQFLNVKARNYHYQQRDWVGPHSGMLDLVIMDSTYASFYHEPYFEYEFQQRLMKMRGIDKERDFPKYLWSYSSGKGLRDEMLTPRSMANSWQYYVSHKRFASRRYNNPQTTQAGNGRMEIVLKNPKENSFQFPLNLLLTRQDSLNTLRVYPGSIRTFHDLAPGKYRLIFIYKDGYYQVFDSLEISSNGLNYHQLVYKDSLRKDSFSLEIDRILDGTIYQSPQSKEKLDQELLEINQRYQRQFSFAGPKKIFRGFIREANYLNPLIGATVLVKGTTIGAITNEEGYFEFEGPSNRQLLIVNYTGYQSQTISIVDGGFVEINLKEEVLMLDEVVITGYGTQKKRNVTGSISSVSVNSFENRTEAEIANYLSGKAAGVQITQTVGLAGSSNNIIVRGYSALSDARDGEPLVIIDGVPVNSLLKDLNPDFIASIHVLKDEAATGLYGARAANGAVIITTKNGEFIPASTTNKGASFDENFLQEASQANSIRSNFSDYAFWQPQLRTDAEGKAHFTVKFPDDVTRWDTHVLAMNSKRQSGQKSESIKSYKPLMAQLAMPRFLIAYDTAQVIGKVLNYLPDSVQVRTRFSIGVDTLVQKDRWVKDALLDSMRVIASGDTLHTTYSMDQAETYSDGERHAIPVFPQGMEETKGQFLVLDQDSAWELGFDPDLGPVSFYARADVLPTIEDELSAVISYKYNCNEQMASKLKALLLEQKIQAHKGEKVSAKREVNKLIRLLMENQKDLGLWGWWKNSKENVYISYHVLEALLQAREQKYVVKDLRVAHLRTRLNWFLSSSSNIEEKIRSLRLLHMLGAQNNFEKEVKSLEKEPELSLNQKLQLMELRQNVHLPIPKDSLHAWMDTTLFGNLYISQKGDKKNLWTNEIQNSLLAYRIFQEDSTTTPALLHKMRNYFLEKRHTGTWRNTYESVQIVEAILPELLQNNSEIEAPQLQLQGAVDSSFSTFPISLELENKSTLRVTKTGSFPMYVTAYQKNWNPKPERRKNEFEISTSFRGAPKGKLVAGKRTTLVAEVQIEEEAEYVMINVPIPASCSYAIKPNNLPNEAHREYFRQETAIFCEKLKPGTYEFEIELMPRYTGSYTLNPAKVELMYFPTFYANNEKKSLRVE